jgi:hypothetical protein
MGRIVSWTANVEARDGIDKVTDLVSKFSNPVKDPAAVRTLRARLQKICWGTIECESMLAHVDPFCQLSPVEIVAYFAKLSFHFYETFHGATASAFSR